MSTTTGGTKLSDDIIAAENSMRMSCNTVTILSPDDADISLPSPSPSSPPLSSSASSSSPSPRIALAYNPKEAAAIQQLFGLLAVNQFSTLKEYIAQTPEGERRDELLRTIVSMAIGSGTPLRLIYLFIVDELKDGSIDAFKPTSDATKMIEFYWELAGRKFLKDSLTPIINQLTVVNKRLSFELDQSKLAPHEMEDMARHRTLVVEHITQLVDKITSKEMVDKIPIPIKAILTQINQLGKERGKHYCGYVFFNRFIGCALADPIAYRLIPGQRFLTQRVRRNFTILATLLRSVLGGSQGVETALAGLTDVLRDLRPRLENFIDGALRSKSLDVGDRFVNEISSRPLNNLHKFILHNQQNILKQFKEEPVALEFFKGIGALAGYNTKWTQFTGYEVPTVSTSDPVAQGPEIKKIREAIKTWLEQKNEIAIFVGFVDKKKKNGQLVKRVLLIGFNRIATFKPTSKIARESSLLDLTLIKSPNTKEFQITTTGWTINAESEEVDHIIACARKAYDYSFTTIPVALKFKSEVQPASRLEVLTPHDRTTTEALVIAYKAACAYLNTPIKQSIITHVNQAYTDDFKLKVPNAKTFNLKHVYKHTIDTPTQAELEPLLFALRHNWYFDTLRIKNHKLERGLWGQVVDIMKYTVSITSLTLDNTNATKDGIVALAEAMMANKGLKLQSLCVANSPLGDRNAAPLMQYLSSHPNIHLLQKLNFSNLGLTATGLTSLANESLPKCTGLTYLNLTGNRLALSTDALVNWAVTAKYLNTLILAGTGFKTRMLAPTIGTSKSLTTLDLSNRRIIKRPIDQTSLSQLAQSGSNIQTLNLDRTQLPADSLKDIATQQYTLQVSHNVLGLAGVQAIMSTHMLDYLKELRLDDTELGDEGVTALCTAVTNHPTLRLLSIGRGFKGSEGSKNRIAAVQSVAKMLQSVGVLEVFHMPGGTSTPYQLKGHMGTILAALHKNDILTDLDISNHAMVNQGAIALAKLIAENYTLSSILWDGNGTGTLGFANVKNALKRNLSVRYMPVPIADIVSVHKDDRVPQPEQQKLSTLLSRIQTYLNRNSQL